MSYLQQKPPNARVFLSTAAPGPWPAPAAITDGVPAAGVNRAMVMSSTSVGVGGAHEFRLWVFVNATWAVLLGSATGALGDTDTAVLYTLGTTVERIYPQATVSATVAPAPADTVFNLVMESALP